MKKPDISKFDIISQSAREKVYSEVLQHFKKHPDSPWSGRGLVELEKTIKAFYASMGEEYKVAFRDTLPDTMKTFYDDAVKEIKTAGVYKGIIGEPDPKRIKYFLDSSYQQVAMKTDKMCFEHIRDLRKLSADVFREVSITGATRREVSKRLLERAMDVKGFEFIDKGGTKWPLKSYFDTLARTELMNAGRASYDDKMAQEGFDVMKLSTSGMSCVKCAAFEGRLFSLTGSTPNLPSKSDLEAAGVFHPNCTHSYSLVPDFIRERDYNPDGTKKTNGDYAKTQMAEPQQRQNTTKAVPEPSTIAKESKTGFTPAQTMQDATEFTKAERGDNVNWKGMDLASVNAINQQMGELSSKYPILAGRYETIGKNGRWKKGVGAHANDKLIEFNPALINQAGAQDVLKEALLRNQRLQANLASWDNAPPSRSKTKAIRELRESLKYGRFNATTSAKTIEEYIKRTATHESGHTALYRRAMEQQKAGGIETYTHWRTGKQTRFKLALEDTEAYKTVNDAMQRAIANGDIYKISKYGSTDLHEFFSESFVMFEFEKSSLPSYIVDALRKVLL